MGCVNGHHKVRDNNGAGRGGAEGWGFHPWPTWFCLALSPSRPAPHNREDLLIPSPPLWALRNPTPPHKTLFFVNLSYN